MLCALIFWFLFGWLADYSFPFGQAVDLMLACFKGTISAKVNNLQQQLQKTDIIPQLKNKKQVQKLNNLESQAWLYEEILKYLGSDPSANHERIAKTLEALEYKRSEILQELEPRRPRKYRILAAIQDSVRDLLASQAEKDYEQLQKIVNNLVRFTKSRQPSEIILVELIDKLATEIAQNTNQISPYRIRLAYKVDELMKVLSAKLVSGSDGAQSGTSYQSLVNELRSRISLLSKEFNNLLRVRQENTNDINRQIKEISSLTNNISELYRDISNRDEDILNLRQNIQDLINSVQEKQAQINRLENLIDELQVELQSATETDKNKQSQKDSEIAGLLSERSQLTSQKSDLQREYQNLYQNYQQQQNEITSLKEKIKDLSQLNYQTTQWLIQETRSKITPEEYQRIANKSDYVFVKAHTRNGSPVKAHYRRRPNR